VAWTKEIVDAEASYRRWTRGVYVGLVLLVVAVAVLLYLVWQGL
jgi:hypothetical protein